MTVTQAVEPWTIKRLRELIQAVDPGATFVPSKVLRRFGIAHRPEGRGPNPFGHRPALIVSTKQARALTEPDELGFTNFPYHLDRLILLERPDPAWLQKTAPEEVLSALWRALFHSMVHEAIATQKIPNAEILQRIEKLGVSNFAEARAVLEEKHRLIPAESERLALTEFTATFLELLYFDPELLNATWPGIGLHSEVRKIVSQDLSVETLLERSRPPGASLTQNSASEAEHDQSGEEDLEPEEDQPGTPPGWRREWLFRRLMAQATKAEKTGNDVRAAICGARAAALVDPTLGQLPSDTSREAIERLALRLQIATEGSPSELEEWTEALLPLGQRVAVGFRGSSARLLYDLQLVALEFERPAYKINLLKWAFSLGRQLARRPLPNHREVQIVRHLRRAVARLGRVRVSDGDRRRLAELLHTVIDRAEQRLRERFRPLIARSLERSDLKPTGIAEKVAFHKLIEELLDQVVEKGFLTSGDVRDALSRNALKLPDLVPQDMLVGDPYLRTDRHLGVALDGIYRRAEIYMRGLQKGSSLAFGTALGRFLTLWLILPFGTAFVFLEGLQHLIEPLLGLFRGEIPFFSKKEHEPGPEPHHGLELLTPLRLFLLGVFFLALIHSPGFRRQVLLLLRGIGSGLRVIFLVAPRAFARLRWVKAITGNPVTIMIWRWLIRPAIPALLTGIFLGTLIGHRLVWTITAFAYLTILWLTHTRLGRFIEEEVREWLRHHLDHLRFNLIPGIYQVIMGSFAYWLDALDRFLYAVDELLRFRQGEGRFALVWKAVAGSLWSIMSYVVRSVVNLLVEPQINPIKHFPVVTVAHKLTLPFMLALPGFLTVPPLQMKPVTASGIAFALQLLIPGVFGFLVWELKENWRLYKANRPKNLNPVIVGSHGETVVRLLRPGFHSGTVARAFAGLRQARDSNTGTGRSRQTHKHLETLIHVEHAVSNFVDREFLQVLHLSRGLGRLPLRVAHTTPTPRRLRVEVVHDHDFCQPLAIVFEDRGGWLVAGLDGLPDWVKALDVETRRTLELALAGLYHRAGVELVREQVEQLAAPAGSYTRLDRRGLRVFLAGPDHEELWFPMREVARQGPESSRITRTSVSTTRQLMFQQHPISWSDWVTNWEYEQAGAGLPTLVLPDILPQLAMSSQTTD